MQEFSNSAGNDWQPAGTDFVKEQTETINVDFTAAGHVLRYVATLVGVNNDVVSFIESNKSILVAPDPSGQPDHRTVDSGAPAPAAGARHSVAEDPP